MHTHELMALVLQARQVRLLEMQVQLLEKLVKEPLKIDIKSGEFRDELAELSTFPQSYLVINELDRGEEI